MPRIYELPASAGPSNESLIIEHAPSFRRRPQQPQGFADPRQMLGGQMDEELNNVTREFDVNVSALDQQMLEPDKYKAQYANLQRRADNQRIAIHAKHQAAAQQIRNMQKLVEDGMLTSEQMQATMLVMAGIPSEHVRRTFAQQQRQKPSTRLNELESENRSIQKWQEKFKDYRGPHFWRGKEKEKLYVINRITGKEQKASDEQREAYDASILRQIEISKLRGEIYSRLTPLEQFAQSGSRAVERFGMGRAPLAAQRFGGVQFAEPAPKKKRELTAIELRKQGTEEAYEKGKKLGYWE